MQKTKFYSRMNHRVPLHGNMLPVILSVQRWRWVFPYVYDGVFKDQEEIDENTIDYSGINTTKLIPGDMKFKDMVAAMLMEWKNQMVK